MRGGTENVYGIVGLAKALELCYAHLDEHQRHILDLKKYMVEKLNESIPGVEYNGDTLGDALYTVLNVSFPPSDIAEMLLMNLDINGVAASGGSACSSGSDVGSHVLMHSANCEMVIRLFLSTAIPIAIGSQPAVLLLIRVDDGARTHDPQNHNLML